MSVNEGARFASTFLDIEKEHMSIPDEMLINKVTGRPYYKNKQGQLIDLFEEFSLSAESPEFKDALDKILQESKEYADNISTSGGSYTRMVSYEYNMKATEGQNEFNIPLSTYDKETDLLLMTVNTVMPDEGYTIDGKKIIFDEGLDLDSHIRLIIVKNIPVDDIGYVNANVLKEGTITEDLIHPDLLEKLLSGRGGTKVGTALLSSQKPYNQTAGSMWIELQQEVNPNLEGVEGDIINGGTAPNDENTALWFEFEE